MSDMSLQKAVEVELDWEPRVDATKLGVSVTGGAVTLTGDVATYAEKTAAVTAAERVYGVTSVADQITVEIPGVAPDDTQIARAAGAALELNAWVPASVQAEVRHGFITLRGSVEHYYQRTEAEQAVRYLAGVKDVFNEITVKSSVKPQAIEQKISAAFQRNARLDARQITVTATDGTAHLYGHVRSLGEKRTATDTAFDAPGVVSVDNQLSVVP